MDIALFSFHRFKYRYGSLVKIHGRPQALEDIPIFTYINVCLSVCVTSPDQIIDVTDLKFATHTP